MHIFNIFNIFKECKLDKAGVGVQYFGSVDGARLAKKKRFRAILVTFLFSSIFILVYTGIAIEQTNLIRKVIGQMPGLTTQVPKFRSPSQSPAEDYQNLLVEDSSNYLSTLMRFLNLSTTSESKCYHVKTTRASLEGLPDPDGEGKISFQTDMVHHLTLVAYEDNGMKRCAGGDYYEVDFHDRDNVRYRSRLPTVDFGNGSYGLELIVPSRFSGDFVLEIWLLFTNWHGMDHVQQVDYTELGNLMLKQEVQMGLKGDSDIKSPHHSHALHSTNLKQCTLADFDRSTWQGRWTRSWFNDSCTSDSEKRFRCLPEEHYWCEEPWCFGPVGRLESNGWQYSAHCGFKIFQREECWKCLDGRWFLMWGDSNSQDTTRNLLLFLLDWPVPVYSNLADYQVDRDFDNVFMNPHAYDQLFQVSQIWNGHSVVSDSGEGLNTLRLHPEHQQHVLDHFKGSRWPDTVIMNSALHDGMQFAMIEDYAESADFAIEWWMQLYYTLPADRRPQLVWRTAVAPAGASRRMTSNPNKMEMYNLVMVEKLQKVRNKLPVKIVDTFDLTFAFHYDNEYSDGGHYGRPPGTNLPPWQDRRSHWYFVDLMVAHIFLNAVCPFQALELPPG